MAPQSPSNGVTRVELAIIGAGIAGAALAYECACYGVDTLVLERAAGPAAGMSGASAGILRTGFAAPALTLETSMIRAGAARWPTIFDELGIPFKVCGTVLIAQESAQLNRLAEIEKQAAEHGVKVRSYDRGQIRNLEPQAKAVGGLLVPAEAITDPYEMVSRLLSTGAQLRYGSHVTAVEPLGDSALVRCGTGDVEARFVVNCAGLSAAELGGDDTFSVEAERGDFIVLPHEAAILTDHIIETLNGTSSATIFPTLYSRLCASTTSSPSRQAGAANATQTADVQAQAARLVPKLAGFTPADSWSGVNAIGKDRGMIAEWSKRVPNMYNVTGLGRAGLVAALGLAAYVLDRCRERGLVVKSRSPQHARMRDAAFPWWQRRKR